METKKQRWDRKKYNAYQVALMRRRYRKNIKFLWKIKADSPCKDCGRYFHPVCMDFDHHRGKKNFNIAQNTRSLSRERLERELKLCEVVCANCHRIRTYKRRKRKAIDWPLHLT